MNNYNKYMNINKKFLKQGYYIFNIINYNSLKYISNEIYKLSKIYFNNKRLKIPNKKIFFNNTHSYLPVKDLNDFRIFVYNNLNKIRNFREEYFLLGKEYLDEICGNELCMQNKINLSIQMPKDDSSLLPIHSDVWSGDSPFEVVLWIPLVNCFKTKSMFILSPKANKFYYNNIKRFNTSDKIFSHARTNKKIKWLNIKFGQGLIFTQNILHGNTVNYEKSSRWSFNCRFKSVFSPFKDKKIGEFFTPISLKPASIFGLNYEEPNI